MRLALLLSLAACSSAPAPAPAPAPAGWAPLPADVTAIDLDTEPGLSGLAVDAAGALWTVAERAQLAYKIELTGAAQATITPIPVDNAPADVDLEAIAVTGADTFALGFEGKGDASAQVAYATLRNHRIQIDTVETLAGRIDPNHGVEGLCFAGGTTLVALETVIEDKGRRLGQVLAQQQGKAYWTPHQIPLTSPTGKLAGLDCWDRNVLAIERHFEVTRLVRVDLATDTATVVRDLADVAGGRNFEGVAQLPDGRIALVVDNQWKTIQGPSQLVILPAASP